MPDMHMVHRMTTISPAIPPRGSNDVSPAPTIEDASPSRNSSHAAEPWQRTSKGGGERGARGRTAARSCDRGGINQSSVHFGDDESQLGGSFDGQVEAARHGLVASFAELTSKRRLCPRVPSAE
jgi:hypothetical protein